MTVRQRRRGRLAATALAAGVGLAMGLGLGGCQATGPAATDAVQLLPPIPPGLARVFIITPEDPFVYANHGDVFINRRRLGRIQAASVLVADVSPGPQVLASNTELRRETTFAVQAGETAWVMIEGGPLLPVGLVYFRLIGETQGRAALEGKRMGRPLR